MKDATALLGELATALAITRPLVVLDCETTGVNPQVARVVELATVKILPDGGIDERTRLVHPGQPIPAEATAVHGITDADVAAAPPFRAIARGVADFLAGADLAGYGLVAFDLPLLVAEFARAGVPFSLDGRRVLDAMRIFHKQEPRDLTAAVRFYSCAVHDAHRAHVDVGATIAVLVAQLAHYPDLPRDVAELDGYCRERGPDWLTADGKIVWRDGAARLAFGKHGGRALVELAAAQRDYLEWMLARDFPSDVRLLVRAALSGLDDLTERGACEALLTEHCGRGAAPPQQR